MSGSAAPPVVMAHGWGGSFSTIFEPYGWREALEVAGCKIVGVDLPGHGRARPASHDPADYADLASGLAAELPEGPLDGIGFSLGSKLLLELECRSPGRFRRLVLGGVGANVFAPERGVEAVAEVLENGGIEAAAPPVQMMVRYAEASHSDPLALAAVLRRPANPVHTADRLKRVRASVLLVNGANDMGVAPADQLSALIPECRSITLSDTGHIDLPQNPTFRLAAVDFLTKP
jgi:pimeloyl-ACP methyl ester carboxylesterase